MFRRRATPIFADRTDAGRDLAARLAELRFDDPVVLALPRGGVPVAYEIASAFDAPLDVYVVRKIGAPGRPELGIGAVAEGSSSFVVSPAARGDIDEAELRRLAEDERREVDRRVDTYRRGRPLPSLTDRDVVLVDDGLATGITAEAAVVALREQAPRRLVLAVPVGAPDSVARLGTLVDRVECPAQPDDFRAVGQWYLDFDQTSDDEVLALLDRSRATSAP
ncbi:MAG: phosphoribosyltransferase [Actinomycetota bacterium]|nr:phosphoribosyltransferase [Actinomycetota bacterium]